MAQMARRHALTHKLQNRYSLAEDCMVMVLRKLIMNMALFDEVLT